MRQLRRMLRKQAGQALPMALILLFIGTIVIIPVLNLAITNLKATQVINQKTQDVYAADAGIDHGLWKVRYNYLPGEMLGDWDETTYYTYEQNPYIYELYDDDNPGNTITVNGRRVEVEIQPIWVLDGLEEIPSQGRTPDGRLLTFSGLNGDGDYEISIFRDTTLDPLYIERIGCWLPPGFHYDEDGVCNLDPDVYNFTFTKSPHNGGEKITWDFSFGGIDYEALPSLGSKKIVTFEFTPSEEPRDSFCWTRTTHPEVPLSWDTSRKIFEITSTAPSDSEQQTTIVSHSVKKEFQALGSAISGDYQATGITLMRDDDGDHSTWAPWCWYFWDRDRRERLYKETSINIPEKATLEDPNGIPDDAMVEKIFLYWSGWKCEPWDPTEAELNGLPVDKQIHKVALKIQESTSGVEYSNTVTATVSQVMRNTYYDQPHGWTYSCFADVTSQVTDYFDGLGIDFYGIATYTVGHWDTKTPDDPGYNSSYRYRLYDWNDDHDDESYTYYTPYPLGSPRNGNEGSAGYENDGCQDEWSHAAWSVIVIYSSPSTAGHHLYLYDEFINCDGDPPLEFTIKGFLAPPGVEGDQNAARMTCFVAEGDQHYAGDNLFLNDYQLNFDEINPDDNVWNGKSNVLGGASTHEGIDIDTFSAGNGIIGEGDTEAIISMPTGIDIWNLVYIVLSFSSKITTGGMIDYTIK